MGVPWMCPSKRCIMEGTKTMAKRILFAVEMVGTYNALESAFNVLTEEHGAAISFVAAGALQTNLEKKGVPCFTASADVGDAFDRTNPDLVVVGVVAGVKTPGGSGLEKRYALAALDRDIPVVVYRDFFGLHPWIDEVARHPKASQLLHFFMFAESTVRTIRQVGLPCAEAITVGSGYYDADVGRDWSAARASGRKAMGWIDHDLAVVFSPGATRDRVFEVLKPTVAGMQSASRDAVFVPTFHPKDPDAPYAIVPGKPAEPRASVYNEVIDRLNGYNVRVVREPEFRNAVPDGKTRVAAADFIIINPLSVDTYTAIYAGVPTLIMGLPLTQAEAAENRIDIGDLDFIVGGAMDFASTADELREYVRILPGSYGQIRNRFQEAPQRFRPGTATPGIVQNLLRVAR